MTSIIAGRLQRQDQVEQAVAELLAAGFARDGISTFYVNPAGQHDLYPIGGDRDESPGTTEADEGLMRGAATGGAIGAAVGVAGIAVMGPVSSVLGAAVGAHIGTLVGSLSQMKEGGEDETGTDNALPQRETGMVVAVAMTGQGTDAQVIAILEGLGADQIERADGTIAGGDWGDFDPRDTPNLIRHPDGNTAP